MKKPITFLAIIIFTVSAHAQVQVPMQTTDVNKVFSLLDTLSSVSKHKLVKVDSLYDQKELIGFKLAANMDTISVMFIRFEDRYNFHEIRGEYNSLLPIWKKYFNPSADASVVASNRGDYARDYKSQYEGWYERIVFRKLQGYWVIK